MLIPKLLENLITKKFYESKEQAQNKLAVFYAVNEITDEEYANLTLKVQEVYEFPTLEVEEKINGKQ